MAEDEKLNEQTLKNLIGPLESENPINNFFTNIYENHPKVWKWSWFLIWNVIVIGYFVGATIYFVNHPTPSGLAWDWEFLKGYEWLLLLVVFLYVMVFYCHVYKPYIKKKVQESSDGCCAKMKKYFENKWIRWSFYLIVVLLTVGFVIVDALMKEEPQRLISLGGFFLILIFGMVFSRYPKRIRLKSTCIGLFLQFILGLVCIKWSYGRHFIGALSFKVATFLKYTNKGSNFVFGDLLVYFSRPVAAPIESRITPLNSTFAFESLSVIFFLAFIVQILYYYNIIQKIVLAIGEVLVFFMGTTITESVNAAANIFFGMTEAPLLLKPYLQDLTSSEIHAVMTAGFATVAGSVLFAYITLGADPAHLVTASLISAPAALCFAKLVYPETEESKSTSETIRMPVSDANGVLDAACRGANDGIALVLAIISNTIAFIAFMYFIDSTTIWFGELVGWGVNYTEKFTISRILTYAFMPVCFLMGVPWENCYDVAYLISIKTMVNEFVAYAEMGRIKYKLSPRVQAITTYALCGFSNPGSIGITVSGLSTLCPTKRHIIVSVVWRSWVSGIAACFLTACIAGMLIS